jgi:hypothetical protein
MNLRSFISLALFSYFNLAICLTSSPLASINNLSICGKRSLNSTRYARIIGGERAVHGSFPWQVIRY